MKSNEVYKITNKLTNKVYIGITNQGSGARYRHHWYESRIGEPSPIHRSMAKYGEESFTLEIIDFADTYDELKEKEKYWIKWYNSTDRSIGYNLTEGGDGTLVECILKRPKKKSDKKPQVVKRQKILKRRCLNLEKVNVLINKRNTYLNCKSNVKLKFISTLKLESLQQSMILLQRLAKLMV